MTRIFFCLTFIFSYSFAQNLYNKNGNKTGVWVGHYETGELKYEGNFIDGKEVGCFLYYYKSGNLESKLCYFNSGLESKVILYFPMGKIKALGNYCNKLRCGLWEFFDSNGNILSKESYSNGLLNGDVIYYFNGIITESYEYFDDKKNGKSVIFYPNGKIYNLSNYFDDKLHGEFSIFDLKGNLIESGEYKLGFRHGEWSTYEYNKKINTVFYNNGEKINEK